MPTVSCPSCGRILEVEAGYRDWTVRCPHCATEFVPSETVAGQFEEDRRDRRRERDDDDDDRPRRRRDSARDEWNRREARALTHGPGVWLEICGWVGGLLLAGGAILWFMVAANGPGNNPNNPNANEEAANCILLGLMSGACAIPYAAVMIVGGRKMRSQTGYGWALAASIMGLSSFILTCFICVFALVPVIFGIWGLIALNNPIVADEFDRNRPGPRWD